MDAFKFKKIIDAHIAATAPKIEGRNDYGRPHAEAIAESLRVFAMPKFDRAIITILSGLVEYARAYETLDDDKIGGDGVMGEYWLDILKGVRGLLNGTTGRISCSDFDTLLTEIGEAAGYEADRLHA